VQTEIPNRFAETLSADAMLEKWEIGFRIAVEQYRDVKTESCHQALPLYLETCK
jgi:hypothetical protein